MYDGAFDDDDVPKSSFFESVKIFWYIFKYLGMVPLKRFSSGFRYLVFDWKSVDSIIAYLITLTVYPAHVFIYYYYLRDEQMHESVYRQRMKFLYMFELISGSLVIAVLFWAYRNIRYIFEKVNALDQNILKNFPNNNIDFIQEKYAKYAITAFGFFIVLLYILEWYLCRIVSVTANSIILQISVFLHIYTYMVPQVVHSTFCIVTAFAIRYRLQILDKLILDYGDKLISDDDMVAVHPSEFLKNIRQAYFYLSECKNAYNTAYGPFQRSIYFNTILILTRHIFAAIVVPDPVFITVVIITATIFGILYCLITLSAEGVTHMVSIQ